MAKKKAEKRDISNYAHTDKQRTNNPPVGLVTATTDPLAVPKKTYQYDPHLDPQLVWAGKAERTSFEVPVVSLHVHERIDPKTIINAVRTNGTRSAPPSKRQLSLFESPEANPPLRDALDFYKHRHGWTNRLVAGDSLLVMNSLLEKEGLADKVQMIYIDPPYGIRYGSNFQPFVSNRDVKDGKDEDLTQEPEMVKAFRDTWELGIHSYLAYLRDRLLLARDLLHESGSVFVQISDENVHHVRETLDDVFGAKNFLGQIFVQKTGGLGTGGLKSVADYLLLYAKNSRMVKYRSLFREKLVGVGDSTGARYDQLESPDGRARRPMTQEERANPRAIPKGWRPYQLDNLTSGAFRENTTVPFEFNGETFHPGTNACWKTTVEGLRKLAANNRIQKAGRTLRYVRYLDDFPAYEVTNLWDDVAGAGEKVYVVQTSATVVRRCLLMTTDPGDLVFDPTCGSGTTAYVAEHWGRRWITCDTSRVAITLAKQRLMTADFDYFTLARLDEGVGSGFVYKTVPHVTLKSIANNPEIREGLTRVEIDAAIMKYAERETLYDQPEIDRSKARVSGPFTVEAVPAVTVRPIETVVESRPVSLQKQPRLPGVADPSPQPTLEFTADVSVSRYGETARQAEWRDELAKTGVRGKGGQKIEFARLEPLGATRCLNAIGETNDKKPKTVAVSFGPEHAPLEQRQVELAWEEARTLTPRPDILLFAAFHFDPEAAKDIDELTQEKTGMLFLRVQMNTDLLTDDLKKKRASNESFWLIGQPDVSLRKIHRGKDAGQWEVEVNGFDYYNPVSGKIESGDTRRIAVWMLDTDYDGRSLYPRQVFFPMAGPKDGWARLAKTLRAEIDEELIEAYRGTVSLPFTLSQSRRVAVKIVDDRGIESLKVLHVD
ncbi:MAG: DNA methyltransferase [Planctomycetota bacterium]|nr:DNA methyltransferase [Planctomycetota bacterium]